MPYKRLDVVIRACAAVRAPLKIVGRGPEETRLRHAAVAAKADVEFAGWLTDAEIRDLYQRCQAALMPGVEDFGMVPVEAQACGRPVVAFAEGGAVESVIDGVTGVLVKDASVDAFAEGLRQVISAPLDSAAIRRHAESFGKERFQAEFERVIRESWSPQQDPREVGFHRSDDEDGVSNAARYAQGRRNFAAREDKQ